MRQLTGNEVGNVNGAISGYEGSGAVLAVLGTGVAIATAPISAPVIGFALGVAAGLAAAQWLSENM